MSLAVLIAQLPPRFLGESATMPRFVAGVTEEADEITPSAVARPLGYVRHWASEMLGGVMVSRPGRIEARTPVDLTETCDTPDPQSPLS